jgi:hypothetical protein
MDGRRAMLRHALATIAYRGGKAVRGAPATFAVAKTGEPSRTAAEILSHLGDLFDWALSMAKGESVWHTSTPLPWDEEVARFHASLARLDGFLVSDAELRAPAERLFQGPIADALTHVGQIAMMRRMAGSPITGENYFVANIETGRVGPDQAPPVRTF